jgi:CBS domain-containing protein
MKTAAPISGPLAPTFEHATVADAMRPWVLTCDPATPLVTIAQRMAGEHVHAIVVLTSGDGGERIPWGVVTDADLLRHAQRVEELTAGEVASTLPQTQPAEPLAAAASRMVRQVATHALVVDPASGRPVGVLSTLDVARVLAWGRT